MFAILKPRTTTGLVALSPVMAFVLNKLAIASASSPDAGSDESRCGIIPGIDCSLGIVGLPTMRTIPLSLSLGGADLASQLKASVNCKVWMEGARAIVCC